MKTYREIISEKSKRDKKFSLDQINAILLKVGVKPGLVAAAINALNAARGIGLIEDEFSEAKDASAEMIKAEEKRAEVITFIAESLKGSMDTIRQLMTGRNPDFNRAGKKFDKEIMPMIKKMGKGLKGDPRKKF